MRRVKVQEEIAASCTSPIITRSSEGEQHRDRIDHDNMLSVTVASAGFNAPIHFRTPVHPHPARPSSLVLSERENALEDLAFTDNDGGWNSWAEANGVVAPKLVVRAPAPEERGKGGVFASEYIAPMEVIARIPRRCVIYPDAESSAVAAKAKEYSWAAELTAAVLTRSSVLQTLSSDDSTSIGEDGVLWSPGGGWATDAADLGGEDGRWGAKDVVGTLMATGSDNDKNIYAKFRFPCHPVVHRAGMCLAALVNAAGTGPKTKDADARDALVLRGTCYRAMRDALIPLVETPTPRWGRGSIRDRCSWDVADTLSRVLARATRVDLDDETPSFAIVPLHERLAHCDSRGENAKLVGRDPSGKDVDPAAGVTYGKSDDVLLIATRPIQGGEAISRDYNNAPRLTSCGKSDPSTGALRLLLQFGLPYAAWPR